MIVSIHQPAYLPWLGYFHKIALSDKFVFFDTTQFERNSFINRNKIKTAQGPLWLTVPVKLQGHFDKEIREIELADQDWQKKHWKSIQLNYKKAKYWDKYASALKKLYEKKHQTIDELCYDQVILFLSLLEIETEMIKSSTLPKFASKKQDLVLDICRELKADMYISGSQGKDYIDEKKFDEAGIGVYFQDYQHPQYEQLWGEFEPYMSAIDLLFNAGPGSLDILMKSNFSKKELMSLRASLRQAGAAKQIPMRLHRPSASQ